MIALFGFTWSLRYWFRHAGRDAPSVDPEVCPETVADTDGPRPCDGAQPSRDDSVFEGNTANIIDASSDEKPKSTVNMDEMDGVGAALKERAETFAGLLA